MADKTIDDLVGVSLQEIVHAFSKQYPTEYRVVVAELQNSKLVAGTVNLLAENNTMAQQLEDAGITPIRNSVGAANEEPAKTPQETKDDREESSAA